MLRLLSGLLICLIIMFFCVYNFYFSVNFPFQDDFLIIQFIEAASNAGFEFSAVVQEMFRTFNDHKAVTVRLLALVEYAITGHQNFRFYILLVSINITYIFYFLYLQFRKSGLPLYYFLPAPFLFFTPIYHEVSGWALNGMQHSFLTVFTVTAILLASRRTTGAFWLAMVFCFLATFTHGNGVISFPAIVFFFLCFKDFKRAILACVSLVACLAIYLIGYEAGQAGQLPTSLLSMLSSLFGFIGSSMSLWPNPQLWSALWGLFIVGFMLILTIRVASIYFNKPAHIKPGTVELLTLFGFIFITSTVIALFRSWAGTTIASRFQLYAALSTVICYILLLNYTSLFRKKQVLIAITALSIIYWGYAHYALTGMVSAKKTTYLADVFNWQNNRNLFSVEKTIVRNADFYLTPGYEKGFFKLPEPVADKTGIDSLFAASPNPPVSDSIYLEDWHVTRMVQNGVENLNHTFVTSDKLPLKKPFLSDRFLVLKDLKTGEVHLLNANPKIEGRRNFLLSGNYYKNGFQTFLRKDDLAFGSYQMAVLDVSFRGEKSFHPLNRGLNVDAEGFSLE
ncbi:hypothetical protein DYBT9623_00323 [Dyadobacter sp. CECT 9623]|uniref:Uncharacterized protein n=1 Tax=Dyadobacter linearis TaxID=2823330 RepID=A0ABM8UJB9_9BACT|nr:hypothetical protein [Dyadobacter sp. CECT 9623]CAG5067602.1 hypothetical protein DYBT9623_00323 [Dyadobacter sp. CECT 9623]